MESEADKAEREKRLATFAAKALGVVRVPHAEIYRLSDVGQQFLREETARQAMDLAESMETEFQRRLK